MKISNLTYDRIKPHIMKVESDYNKYVKNEDISQKKFCCLINSHDNGNTRVPIYKQLSKISDIDCPGKLLNNCSNEELNSIGNFEFIKKYLIIFSKNILL